MSRPTTPPSMSLAAKAEFDEALRVHRRSDRMTEVAAVIRQAGTRAKADERQAEVSRARAIGIAVGHVFGGRITQKDAADLLGIDRMTLRRYMGQRTSADHNVHR